MSTLKQLKIGEAARITSYKDDSIPSKMYELGLLPGETIVIKCKAPFNGPLCVCYGNRGGKLALRDEEAGCILVEKL